MGRHGGPGGDEGPSDGERPAGGRRRAPEPTATPPDAPRPDDDELTTLGRRTRAERRREGSLPPGEDPMSGRPVRSIRPTPPPPGPPARPVESARTPPPGRADGEVAPRDGAPPPVSGPRTTSDPLTTTRPPVPRTPALRAPSTTNLPVPAGPPPAPPHEAPPAGATTSAAGATTEAPRDRVPEVPATPAPSPSSAPVPPPPGTPRLEATPSATTQTPGDRRPGTPGPATGPQGGRAAFRAERQAADAARRKDDRRRGTPPEPTPLEEPRRGSRSLVIGLVAVVVVALVLLSVWSFQRTDTDEAARSQPVAPTTAATTQAPAPTTTAAPGGTPAAPAPTGPVFAPVSVLNSAGISGLAADIGDQLVAGGWEIRTLGTYGSDDVATTTVFYTEGDTTQQQAAESLVAQFPEVSGPAVRFFEIPDLPDPGIVVIADGSWRP